MLTPLNKDIVDTFIRNFEKIKNDPIVLYGTGEKTKIILENINGFHISGLMDKAKTGECLYGLKVLEEKEVKEKAKYIIIVCNYSSAHLIYARIKNFASKCGIKIYHLNGTYLTDTKDSNQEQLKLNNKMELIKKIRNYDVISFDLFDTIIMRKCLLPEDIYALTGLKYYKNKNAAMHFCSERKASEKNTYDKLGAVGTFSDIYLDLKKRLNLSKYEMQELMECEIQTELDNIVVRKDIVEILIAAKVLGKRIIIVSDMYLPKTVIELIIEKAGIGVNDYDKLYLSCEEKKSKVDGTIWDIFKSDYCGEKILHIGDNPLSDGEIAERKGINSFIIFKAYDMLSSYDISSLDANNNTLENRIILGQFAALAFNSPFGNDSSKREISSLYEVGELFFGPVIAYFILFIKKIIQKHDIKKILLLARDGYVLKTIFEREKYLSDAEIIYFPASRRSLAGGSIYNEEDIDFILGLFAPQSEYIYEQFLEYIFGVVSEQADNFNGRKIGDIGKDELHCHIKEKYKDAILSESSSEKNQYDNFMRKCNIEEGEKIAVINFIGSGVTQSLFEKTFPELESFFLYVSTTPQNVKISTYSPVFSAFESGSIYTSRHNALVKYMIAGECVFTAPQSQFMRFNKKGQPVYFGNGENYVYNEIRKCHEGICSYIKYMEKTIFDFSYEGFDKKLIDEIYGLLYSGEIFEISDEIKRCFCMEDVVKSDKICQAWIE